MNIRFRLQGLKFGTFTLLICSLLFPTACGSARRGEPITVSTAISDPYIEQGQIVFMRNCHKCHPGGEAGLAPAINNKSLPEFLMRFQVRHGIGAMPSFTEEEITATQLDNLMKYLKELRRSGG